jgi:hypothetical protein
VAWEEGEMEVALLAIPGEAGVLKILDLEEA